MNSKIEERLKKRYGSSTLKNEPKKISSKIDITKIKIEPQARTAFPEAAIQKRMQSLLKVKQLSPVVLIKIGDDYYMEDGELTWRSAQKLVEQGNKEWGELDYVLSNSQNSNEIRHRSFLHHQHSVGLNALDRAINMMIELKPLVDKTDTLIKILNNLVYKTRKDPQLKDAVEQFYLDGKLTSLLKENFDELQLDCLAKFFEVQYHPLTFIKTEMRFVTFPEDLKDAIRSRALPCSFAKEINKLNSTKLPKLKPQEISDLRTEAIELGVSNISRAELSKWIKSAIALYTTPDPVATSVKAQKALGKAIVRDLSALDISVLSKTQLKSLESSLLKKLKKIEATNLL